MISSTSQKKYKDNDPVYAELLCLSRVSDSTTYDEGYVRKAILTLNRLPDYMHSHWRLVPLLANKAKELGVFHSLDDQVQNILISETQKGVARELVKLKQVEQIVSIVCSEGIPIILLKGSALNDQVYSMATPRLSSDIDILVKKRDLGKTIQLLSKHMKVIEKRVPGVFGDYYEIQLSPKGGPGLELDLHTFIVHPMIFDTRPLNLWTQSIKHPRYQSELVRMLDVEQSIVHQAIHAFKDMNFSKYNIVDTFELLNTSGVDSNKLIRLVLDTETTVPFFFLIRSIEHTFGDKLEHINKQSLRPNWFSRALADWLIKSYKPALIAADKDAKYRLKQIMSLIVFSGSIIKPLRMILEFYYFKFKLNLKCEQRALR